MPLTIYYILLFYIILLFLLLFYFIYLQTSFITDIRLGSKYVSDYGQTQKQSYKDILKIRKILRLCRKDHQKYCNALVRKQLSNS